MNILKSRLLWLAPLIALLVLMLLATAFYPGYNPKPHKLPIAIVNNDKGMDMQGNKVNVGEQFVKNIKIPLYSLHPLKSPYQIQPLHRSLDL
ncbi:hypothetical protein [Staphylococcus massiliensis]|uniref:hypothetical protein n=1 Tax=Staphylococcus massiliensis TaxID=555791 RepID=UPI001EDEB8F8|nr:hypothetical protein [Staphylococcus massiliensis]MCG3398684.1 hypothetical protein [Staphylococcus massiliensis]MCG3412577.1 hypothetical protein [Staphylococcus massiliensis]